MTVTNLQLKDALQMPEFDKCLAAILNEVDINHKRIEGEYKRDVYCRLKESGEFNAADIKNLFIGALNKELNPSRYPSTVRNFIIACCYEAFKKLVEQLKENQPQIIGVKKDEKSN